ncbi:aminotransferase class I/II-fold pyridoxal phosphate-dependent enzyme [Terrabacter sp. 2YAF2]|uniref:aminotransferase class I/II-fold pyridoxal phosphate-dependent enzyme n=1 Tax=Terrabacter sp. 2YAF2 TaxID=3233026 RepID=UPI003F9717CD
MALPERGHAVCRPRPRAPLPRRRRPPGQTRPARHGAAWDGLWVASPEGTFYLWPRSPVPDHEAFVASLERRGVLVIPGALFETPGWFRICLTATAESIEAALPHFRAAIEATR